MLDAAHRSRDFPTLARMTYLNTAAEGVPPLPVGEALATYFDHKQMGSAGREYHMLELDAARAATAGLFGLTTAEVGICSNSSEAFNLAALALRLQPGDEVVVNDLDFPAGRTPWLQEGSPATVRVWRAREGALRVEDLVPLLGPRTRLVSTSLVSYFNGFTIPLPAVVEAVRAHSPALLALDVTQALGRIPLDLRGADLIISSTHKWIMASHGGGLVGVPAARTAEWTSPAGGWFNLESPFTGDAGDPARSKPGAASFMAGMPNFPAIYAIRAALDYLTGVGVDAIYETAQPLLEHCLDELTQLPVEVITPRERESLAGIIAFRHPQMEEVFERLKAQSIQVMHSAGRIRVSVHGYNTPEDIEHFLSTLRMIVG
ncbi:MAG: csd 1 [Armatimonadetes bacterium]|nr:csd 1 [Armatimonadota bacterium]